MDFWRRFGGVVVEGVMSGGAVSFRGMRSLRVGRSSDEGRGGGISDMGPIPIDGARLT